MSNDEIAGRLIVLEVFSLTALGLYLANASNDPDYSKAATILNYLRESISERAKSLPPSAQIMAEQYVEHLVSSLTKNLRTLRGEGGRSQ